MFLTKARQAETMIDSVWLLGPEPDHIKQILQHLKAPEYSLEAAKVLFKTKQAELLS